MSFSFAIACESVGGSFARRGALCLPNRNTIETPAMLIDTKVGAIPHLTKDIVKSKLGATSFGLNLSLGHFIQYPGLDGLKKMEQTIQEFAALDELPTYLSIQDASNRMPHEYNDKSTVSVWQSSGRKRVTVEEYSEFVKQAAPDMFESLSDTLLHPESTKRTDKSISRSIEHLDKLINLFSAEVNSKLFASLEGGNAIDKRVAMARMISHRPVAGFSINGITEDMYNDDVTLLADLLKNIHKELPALKPRLLHNIGTPKMALIAIANGVDILDGSYLTKLKEKNLALTIPFDKQPKAAEEHSETNILMDISREEFKTYFHPIQANCPCYTCANYTCAYLNHLFATHEMLFPILIMIHNINQYQRFFAEIREHISKQTFEEYHKKIDILTKNNPIIL